MNYNPYAQSHDQLPVPQTDGCPHLPAPLHQTSRAAGIELGVPPPFQLTQLTQSSQGPPGTGMAYQSSSTVHMDMDVLDAPISRSMTMINVSMPSDTRSIDHTGHPPDMLSFFINQSQAQEHQEQQQQGSTENTSIDRGARMEMEATIASMVSQQDAQNFPAEPGGGAASSTPGNHGQVQQHQQQQSPKTVSAQKKRKPLSERRRNVAKAVEQLPRHPPLPGGCRYMFEDRGGGKIIGVLASRVIEMGEKFGPFVGCLLDEETGRDIESTWEICVRGKVKYYVDGTDKSYDNWLYYVQPACFREEQNMEAFQSYGDIYFRALDTIQPGTELRVFYSREYREKVGCRTTLSNFHYDRGTKSFECKDCGTTATSSKSMTRHLKLHHTEKSNDQNQPSDVPRKSSDGTRDNVQPLIGSNDATRKLYQYVLHGGGKEDANLQKNIQAKEIKRDMKNQLKDKSREIKKTLTEARKEAHMMEIQRRIPHQEDSNHTCSTCGKSFSSKGKLAAHQTFHYNATDFKCDECDFVCQAHQTFQRHKYTHIERAYKCELCGIQSGHLSTWIRHLIRKHSVRPLRGTYYCCYCRHPADNAKAIQMHLRDCIIRKTKRTKIPAFERIYSDKRCKKRETDILRLKIKKETEDEIIIESDESIRQELLECISPATGVGGLIPDISGRQDVLVEGSSHTNPTDTQAKDADSLQSSTAGQKFKCDSCSAVFISTQHLQKHTRLKHNKVQFQCEICSHVCLDHPAKMIHMRKHSKDRPYKCTLCPLSFSSQKALDNHQIDHTDAKPFKCDLCYRSFGSKKLIYKHKVRIHQKPGKHHECPTCHKMYSEKSSLKKHQERHLGIKRFKCDVCKKGFTSKDSVKVHMAQHSEEMPFECKICGKRFKLNHNLDRHAIRHLPDLEQNENV